MTSQLYQKGSDDKELLDLLKIFKQGGYFLSDLEVVQRFCSFLQTKDQKYSRPDLFQQDSPRYAENVCDLSIFGSER